MITTEVFMLLQFFSGIKVSWWWIVYFIAVDLSIISFIRRLKGDDLK